MDLEELKSEIEKMGIGRTKHALTRVIAGEAVDLAEYPRNPLARAGKRSTYSFVRKAQSFARKFKCLKLAGTRVFVAEMFKPKSYLK